METELVVQLWLGFMTLAGVVLAAAMSSAAQIYARRAGKHAKEANDAVNSNKDPEAPRIYDLVRENSAMVRELRDWKQGFVGSPFESGERMSGWAGRRDTALEDIRRRVKSVEDHCPACPRAPDDDKEQEEKR